MRTSTLLRLSGLALVVGGLLFAVGVILVPPGYSEYGSTQLVHGGLLKLIGVLLLLLGLPGMYARQSAEAGRLGFAGFIMVFLGLGILEVSTGPLFTFMVPVLAQHPETQFLVGPQGHLETQLGPLFLAYFAPGLLSTNLGLLLLGIATLRARVFPSLAAVLLIAYLPLTIIISVVGAPLVLMGIVVAATAMLGLIWCGLVLWSERSAAAEQPDRVR